jgi:hypothetical protein
VKFKRTSSPSLSSDDDDDVQKEMLLLSPNSILFQQEFNLLLPLGNRVVEIQVPTGNLCMKFNCHLLINTSHMEFSLVRIAVNVMSTSYRSLNCKLNSINTVYLIPNSKLSGVNRGYPSPNGTVTAPLQFKVFMSFIITDRCV